MLPFTGRLVGDEAYTARKQAVKISSENCLDRDADAVRRAEGSTRAPVYGKGVLGSPESLAQGMLPKGFSRNPRELPISSHARERQISHREVRGGKGDQSCHERMAEQSYDPILPLRAGNRRASARSGHGTHRREGGNKPTYLPKET